MNDQILNENTITFDNNEHTLKRYSVVYLFPFKRDKSHHKRAYVYASTGKNCYQSTYGFRQHGELNLSDEEIKECKSGFCATWKHLGKIIDTSSLPDEPKNVVINELEEWLLINSKTAVAKFAYTMQHNVAYMKPSETTAVYCDDCYNPNVSAHAFSMVLLKKEALDEPCSLCGK